ncbi:hypothetical protein [Halobacterium yunchengense]|uniref:hypothetical protein n=1 Tax=Halobacterium yunchengense TaxID=3108497 RepID=UPI00300A88E6
MAAQDDRSAVEITRMSLRGDGWIGYSEDAVYVDEGGDDRVKIPHDAVEAVTLRTLEWDLAVMSLLLVGVGAYVVVTRNPLVGVAFAAVGAFSAYRTYRHRHELAIRVRNRPKPLTVHPEHPHQCLDALSDRVGLQKQTGP